MITDEDSCGIRHCVWMYCYCLHITSDPNWVIYAEMPTRTEYMGNDLAHTTMLDNALIIHTQDVDFKAQERT